MLDRNTAEVTALPRTGSAIPSQVSGSVRWIVDFSRHKPLGAIGGAMFLVLIVVAVFSPLIAPYDERATHGDFLFVPPGTTQWLLGTDDLGRDVFSRVVAGARISLYVGIGSVLIGMTIGFVVGIASTYAGGKVDMTVQRFVDALLALPGLIIALAIMAVLGPSLNNVIIAIVIGMLAPVIRTVRSQVLTLKELDYVLAARAVGAGSVRIIMRHMIPNVAAIWIVTVTFYMAIAIIAEASLSFLGFGAGPDVPSWGGMLSGASSQYVKLAPWLAVFPGIAIAVVVFSWNVLGDALRDVLDPRLKGTN